jgi:hypothetical protein
MTEEQFDNHRFKLARMLECKIEKTWEENRKRPTFIVCHPKTYYDLYNECLETHLSISFINNNIPLKFLGIDVLRSTDVEENEFKAG